MTKVVGVRFRQVGKIYFFAPGKYSVDTYRVKTDRREG